MHAPSLPAILLILLVVIIFFGGKGKLSGMMTDLAQGIKGFKKGLAEEEQKPSDAVQVNDNRTIDAEVKPKTTRTRGKTKT